MIEIDYSAIDEWRDQELQEIYSILDNLGLKAVGEARKRGDYQDRTGNLRSSIGYVVVDGGRVISEGFEFASSGTDGGTGVNNARSFAHELAKEFNDDIYLILVAGMNYAAFVENGHYYKVGDTYKRSTPRDVLSFAANQAEQDLPRMLEAISE